MMTPQEMLIGVAEAHGWIPNGTGYWRKDNDVRALVEEPDDGESPWPTIHALPDYTGDLNAMHEAEKTLTRVEIERFGLYLRDYRNSLDRDWHTTAAHRAEAFCRVKYPERFKD